MCIKAFKAGSKEKFFINVCHTSEIPAPRDITEKELHKLIEDQNPSDFKVPLSVTKPRKGKDKSGKLVDISDVAVNTEFFAKKIKFGEGLFYSFLVTLVFESLEQKYKIEIDSNFILLKNRACIDQLVEHQIYNRDVKSVERFHQQSDREMLGSDEESNIVIGSGQHKKPGKVLIEEIPSSQTFKPRKSITIPNVIEPEHRLTSNSDDPDRTIFTAEFYVPLVRSIDEITVEANDDRIVVNSQKHGYMFDGFLPQNIDANKTAAEFDIERMMLKVSMTT